MNTRNFLKSVLVMAIAPAILLPKAEDRQRWKRTSALWVPNPAYQTAEYEFYFYNLSPCFDRRILEDVEIPTKETRCA